MDVKTPWPICSHCKEIPKSLFHQSPSGELFERRRKYNLRVSFAALRNSASRGCHACTLFHDEVREPYRSDLETVPVYLETLFEQSSALARTTALTVDLHRVVRSETSAESKSKSAEYQCPYGGFEFDVVAEVRWTSEEAKVPLSAKHHQGWYITSFVDVRTLMSERRFGKSLR